MSSRPLKSEEVQAGLQAIPIVRDALAVAVGQDNPYQGGLTLNQLKQIFQGKTTNWSQVGSPDLPIRVVNRSPDSGTYTFFRYLVARQQTSPAAKQFIELALSPQGTAVIQRLGFTPVQ